MLNCRQSPDDNSFPMRVVAKKCKMHESYRGQSLKLKLFMTFAVGITLVSIEAVSCQQHSHINSPPILVVPDRNWRISETEPVGQIISRIRADDSENDELVFGLEPAYKGTDNLFRIDPVGGVVYLNKSLIGRGGENFFLYITVTDGQLTAKNEVYVNILPANGNSSSRPRPPPTSISNITHFLPSFDRLPGVQSVRNQHPNRPFNILPPQLSNIYPPPKFTSYHQTPISSDEQDNDDSIELTTTFAQLTTAPTTSRTKLTPITDEGSIIVSNASSGNNADNQWNNTENFLTHKTNGSVMFTSLKSQMIPFLLAVCGLFVAAAATIGFLYRKRLCAFTKKKSKEEMVKKLNPSNLSSGSLTDDSHNSLVMRNWSGPIAFGNRYVPWEKDQQAQQQHQVMQESIATSQASTSAMHGVIGLNQSGIPGSAVGALSTLGENIDFNGGLSPNEGSLMQQKKCDKWEFPRHRLKFFNILGEGAFGQVWRCEAVDIGGNEGITIVAVKTIKENATEIEKKDLISELEVMKSLEPHINVIRFLGCCTEKDPIFAILEYVNRGKLQTYLRNSRAERHYGNTHGKSNILTSGDLTSFMHQVAKGMDYLTSRGIIHRDLAARNVLITDDHTCKVADFGFARDIITSKVYERKSEGKLPIRWMAVESLYDNIFSIKSDVWSFGILMWEIVTLGSTPYPGISASDVMRKVRDGYRLEKPEHCRRELYNIMYYCWSQEPNERPSFGELVEMLDKLLHTEMDYIELERFPDHNYYNIINLSGEKV